MSLSSSKFVFLFSVVLTIAQPLLCQIEGESEATTIILKKPGISESADINSDKGEIRDTVPPEITIISPQVDASFTAEVSASDVFVIGRLTDESGIQSFRINDKTVATDDNGFFQETLSLVDGLNIFRIAASDRLSNSCNKLLTLIHFADKEARATTDDIKYNVINHGLIIGINNYIDPAMIDLDNPIIDATFLYSTLIGNYMFDPENVTLLKDPSRADIIHKLDELSYRLTKKDNLLIFYAGHGYWDSEKETGFWLPADAEKSSSVNWIRNRLICH